MDVIISYDFFSFCQVKDIFNPGEVCRICGQVFANDICQTGYYLSVKGTSHLHWFHIASLNCDWLPKLGQLSQPMKSKTNTNIMIGQFSGTYSSVQPAKFKSFLSCVPG